MDPTDSVNDRLIRLESALMHLGHDVEQMHQAILAQQRELEAFRRVIERLEAATEHEDRLAPESTVRDPAAEKPPHY
jgi:SlyX protein